VNPKLSVVVPVYNEGATLFSRLSSMLVWLDAEYGREAYELIVVDDGSTDASRATIESFARRHVSCVALAHGANCGMNAAVRTGVLRSSGECVVTFDSDLTYEPAAIGRLVGELHASGSTVCVASPYMRGGACVGIPLVKRLLSRWANRFLSYATRGRHFTMTGIVRAYRGNWLRDALSVRAIDATYGLFFEALRCGAPIVEIPETLDWSAQPKDRARRVNLLATARRTWRVFCAGIAARPALLAGIPGLLPGILPAVVLIALFLHASTRTLAIATGVTIAIQYTSLALVGLQVGDFLTNGAVLCKRP
jgi:glycosyltransferase involved in cell wall biosynthesis